MNAKPSALPSLRRELSRTLALISAVWLVAVFLTMAWGVRHEIDDVMDDALHEATEVLYGMLTLNAPSLPMGGTGSMPAPPHEERLVWQIVDGTQQVLLRSHKAPATPLLPVFRAGLSDSPEHWRVYAMRLPGAGHALYVGQPAAQRLEARYEAIMVVGLSGVLVGLACALWMRRRIGQAMEPMQLLSEQVQHYDPMRPATMLPAPSREEFVAIRQAIVDLGQRLARRVESEQAFAAHAAHALRTPLAGMDAQLAIAMKEVPDPARSRLQRVREAVSRLKHVVTSLLAMFRSNAEPELQDIDLAALVARLPVEGLAVQVNQEASLLADPNLLAAALANLLDNALRHGARNCRISCRADGATRLLEARDDGPGMPPEQCLELQRNLDDPAAEARAGLGLKLAAMVARAHHGQLLIDPGAASTQGFGVTMVLWMAGGGTSPAPAPVRPP